MWSHAAKTPVIAARPAKSRAVGEKRIHETCNRTGPAVVANPHGNRHSHGEHEKQTAEPAGSTDDVQRINAQLPPLAYDVWHDRAVFHFLTNPEDRRRYVQVVRSALKVEDTRSLRHSRLMVQRVAVAWR